MITRDYIWNLLYINAQNSTSYRNYINIGYSNALDNSEPQGRSGSGYTSSIGKLRDNSYAYAIAGVGEMNSSSNNPTKWPQDYTPYLIGLKITPEINAQYLSSYDDSSSALTSATLQEIITTIAPVCEKVRAPFNYTWFKTTTVRFQFGYAYPTEDENFYIWFLGVPQLIQNALNTLIEWPSQISITDETGVTLTSNTAMRAPARLIVTATADSGKELSEDSIVPNADITEWYSLISQTLSDDKKTLVNTYGMIYCEEVLFDTLPVPTYIGNSDRVGLQTSAAFTLTQYESTTIEYTVTSQLTNCTATGITTPVTDSDTLTITVTANVGYSFTDTPYIQYTDTAGATQQIPFTLSSDTQTATITFPIASYPTSDTAQTYTIVAAATYATTNTLTRYYILNIASSGDTHSPCTVIDGDMKVKSFTDVVAVQYINGRTLQVGQINRGGSNYSNDTNAAPRIWYYEFSQSDLSSVSDVDTAFTAQELRNFISDYLDKATFGYVTGEYTTYENYGGYITPQETMREGVMRIYITGVPLACQFINAWTFAANSNITYPSPITVDGTRCHLTAEMVITVNADTGYYLTNESLELSPYFEYFVNPVTYSMPTTSRLIYTYDLVWNTKGVLYSYSTYFYENVTNLVTQYTDTVTYPVVSQLTNCTAEGVKTPVTLADTLNITLTANDGYSFKTTPVIRYLSIDTGLDTDAPFTLASDAKTATITFATSTHQMNEGNSYYIIATATSDTTYENKYGSIFVYKVTTDNLQDFAAARFTQGDEITDLGDFIAKLHRVYCDIGETEKTTLTVGNIQLPGIEVETPKNDIISLSCGSVTIPAHNQSNTDFENEITIFLPFVGFQTLPANLTGQTLTLNYKCNIITGDAVATLSNGDIILYEYPCKMSSDILYLTNVTNKVFSQNNFEDTWLMGFIPFVVVKWYNDKNNATRFAANARAQLNTLTGFVKATEITPVYNTQITTNEQERITQLLAAGVYI